jgi:transcriptional regulator with XRE-family HTH domain
MADTPQAVGSRIARRRHQLGWTQIELAEKLGVSPSTVANWERGASYPKKKLGKVEHVLGVSLDDVPPERDPLPPSWRAIISRKPADERDLWEQAALEFLGEIPAPDEDAGEGQSQRGRRAG